MCWVEVKVSRTRIVLISITPKTTYLCLQRSLALICTRSCIRQANQIEANRHAYTAATSSLSNKQTIKQTDQRKGKQTKQETSKQTHKLMYKERKQEGNTQQTSDIFLCCTRRTRLSRAPRAFRGSKGTL